MCDGELFAFVVSVSGDLTDEMSGDSTGLLSTGTGEEVVVVTSVRSCWDIRARARIKAMTIPKAPSSNTIPKIQGSALLRDGCVSRFGVTGDCSTCVGTEYAGEVVLGGIATVCATAPWPGVGSTSVASGSVRIVACCRAVPSSRQNFIDSSS